MGNSNSNNMNTGAPTRRHTCNRSARQGVKVPPVNPHIDAQQQARVPAPMPAPVPSAAIGPPAAPSSQVPMQHSHSKDRKQFRELITGSLRDVNEFYDIEKKELGHGHYGSVRIGINKSNGKKVAIKTIPKAKVSRPETMRREIEILKALDHPNIIRLFDVFESTRHLHLVTELCTGGELFDRIIARGHYSENDAATLVRKIIDAIKHCHERDICHRDLKPENFLFETQEEDAELKVIDFGLSRMEDENSAGVMTTRVGTPYYIAPEVLGRQYDKSCDLWSIGVITYILLCGYPPFYGDTDPEIFASVRKGKYDFDTPEWSIVSKEAKDFISRLLLLDASKRLTAIQALQHPWVSGAAPNTQMMTMNSQVFSSLQRFTGHNKLKKAALNVIADFMTENEIVELKKEFMAIDTDGNGVITVAELANAMRQMGHGLIEEEVKELLAGIDIDGDGLVDYSEFLAATMKKNLSNKENYLQNAFSYFDTKKQGVITKADLVCFMGSEEQAQEVMNEVDTDGDGMISFQEFVIMMNQKGFGDESDLFETEQQNSMVINTSNDTSSSFHSAQFSNHGGNGDINGFSGTEIEL
jgi:calcium-dependent protein kinase